MVCEISAFPDENAKVKLRFHWTRIKTGHCDSQQIRSHLATQLGYSAGEFQALQLIVIAAFGLVD